MGNFLNIIDDMFQDRTGNHYQVWDGRFVKIGKQHGGQCNGLRVGKIWMNWQCKRRIGQIEAGMIMNRQDTNEYNLL